jgi:hypothetical protein
MILSNPLSIVIDFKKLISAEASFPLTFVERVWGRVREERQREEEIGLTLGGCL